MQDDSKENSSSKSEAKQRSEAPPSEGFGEAYYFNEKGLLVFTSKYLLDRGYCCGNGCKHCPYDYEAVPEPKRSFLLKNRNNEL
jgi:hypothetical protein